MKTESLNKCRIIALLLAVFIFATVIPIHVSASTGIISGSIGESLVTWEFDPGNGNLTISGTGDCSPFQSANDQPWSEFREEISQVWIQDTGDLAVSDISYWFDGCTALTMGEIPYSCARIGTRAFADCPQLRIVLIYQDGAFSITEGAFAADEASLLEIWYASSSSASTEIITSYDWGKDNRSVYYYDVYSAAPAATGYCYYCKANCSYTLEYVYWTEKVHSIRHWCSNCGKDQTEGGQSEAHTLNNGVCTKCGYDDGSGSKPCSHSYSYGAWEYYNSSQHRRLYSCSKCGDGSYSYGYHSSTLTYSQYSSTKHKVTNFCTVCFGSLSSPYYEIHSYTYSDWSDASDTQHSRTATCSSCGYSSTEFAEHTDADNNGTCDGCGRSMYLFSVTLPAALAMTMSESGEVHTCGNVVIVNNSSADVEVTSITVDAVGNWTLVPFAHNMAAEKVDSQLIGFKLNDAFTTAMGSSETLSLYGDWRIEKGADLPLIYDAVVSATSVGYENEQVLSLVFVISWAQ